MALPMISKWMRGRDRQRRLFVFAFHNDRVTMYFPDLSSDELRTGRGSRRDEGVPVGCWRDEFAAEERLIRQLEYEVEECVDATANPGDYYPRMWRGRETPPPYDTNAQTASIRIARNLYAKLRAVFDVVEPVPTHRDVFGHELRQLLILACTEVESSWRAILKANGHSVPNDRFTTHDYFRLLGPMRLDHYEVAMPAYPDYGLLRPFDGWKFEEPSKSLGWYHAYNKTKHDRENELPRATLHNVVSALGAVHILGAAQFGFGEQGRGRFQPDAFMFTNTPGWLADGYIRPLALPGTPEKAWKDAKWIRKDFAF